MSHALVRHSFHGPLTGAAPRRRRRAAARSFEVTPEPSSQAELRRALLSAARREEPDSEARERILANVLRALEGLTGTRSKR